MRKLGNSVFLLVRIVNEQQLFFAHGLAIILSVPSLVFSYFSFLKRKGFCHQKQFAHTTRLIPIISDA